MKRKVSIFAALTRANDLADALAPACERLLIAGSIRREKPEIGDIELVLIPKLRPVLDMFDESTGQYESLLDEALAGLDLVPTKDGDRYKQVVWREMQADLFIATPETWGCVATIRTGSAEFTKWLVTKKRKGGACPEHLSFSEGRLLSSGAALDTSEEHQVFAALGLAWVKPEDRIDGRWPRNMWS